MPRPSRPWFRFYSEALESRKAQSLPPVLFKHWVNLLCLANVSKPRGRLPSLPDIVYAFRPMSEKRIAAVLAELCRLHFLDMEEERIVLHDWDDWQKDSDANLTPGRAAGRYGGRYEGDSAGETRGNGEDSAALVRPRGEERRGDKEEEGEERRGEGDAPAFPFSLIFSKEYQRRHAGRPPPQTEHAAAIALEREYGADACIQAASDFDWQKHPNYLRPILQERRNGKPNRTSSGESAAAAHTESVADRVQRMVEQQSRVPGG